MILILLHRQSDRLRDLFTHIVLVLLERRIIQFLIGLLVLKLTRLRARNTPTEGVLVVPQEEHLMPFLRDWQRLRRLPVP